MSIRANDLYRTDVVTAAGKRVGRISDVLFHAEKPAVVGYVVERPRLLYLLDRKDRYLAFDKVAAKRDLAVVTDAAGAWDAAAAKRLDIDWETTVIWSGMQVKTASGKDLGLVKDVVFSADGVVETLALSGGTAADVAVGLRTIEGALVRGYRGGAVVVEDAAAGVETSGGVSAAAGRQAAVLEEQARQGAIVAGKAIKTAADYGKAAAKVAAKSESGKKTIKWLRSVRDEIIDAMGDPDDE